MKHLKLVMTLLLSFTVTAVIIASYNLLRLYQHEKAQITAIVRECAENAFLLEMIGRMKEGEEATQSFIRLNHFVEGAQQREGISGEADTLQISLADLLRVGLEFKDNEWQTDYSSLNRIFLEELHRKGLMAKQGFIFENGSEPSEHNKLWKLSYSLNPSSSKKYILYVSPMRKDVLIRLWGIIIPFTILTLLFSFMAIYLTGIINKMRKLEQMKDDFTHNMTHELKTPVAVAYSAADSMLRYYDQSDEARNKQFLKIIMQRLSFLAGMIENILSMSMERFKTMKLNIEQIAVKPLIEEVARMIELKADKEIKIVIDIPDNLTIMADSLHLGNVLSNLMDNAVKYSGDSVVINIKSDMDSIVIADNGIGIEKTELPFIFDKFYRVSSGNRYEVGGYGLGLFYVKQIIELLGWSIVATSKPGLGTKFTIKFNGNEKK